MITLKKIQLNNFLSHKETILNFVGDEKILIDGKSGSGKSTIVEAVLWGFYGKGRTENRSMIMRGEKSAKVEIIIKETSPKSDISHFYSIKRTITNSSKHNLVIRECSKKTEPEEVDYNLILANNIRELQTYLEKTILKSSYTLFINSIVYPQENYENFVNQTAAKRKDILLEIAKADQYDDLYIKTREKINKINESKAKNEGRLSILSSLIVEDKKTIVDLGAWETQNISLIKQIKEITDKKKRREELLVIYNAEQDNYERKKEQIKALETSILLKEERLNEYYKEKKGLKGSEFPENDIKDVEKIKQTQKEIQFWTSKMMEIMEKKPNDMQYEVKIEELNEQFIKLSNIDDIEECPEIKKKCPILVRERRSVIANVTEDIEKYKTLHLDYMKLVEEYGTNIKNLGTKPEIDESRLYMLESKIKTFEQTKIYIIELKTKIDTISEDLKASQSDFKTIKEDFDTIVDKSVEIASIIVEIDKLEHEEADTNLIFEEVKIKLLLARVAEERFKKNKIEEKILLVLKKEQSTSIENLELLKEAFGHRGVKAIIIDFIIPRLEDKINEILHQLSDFTIRLDTQKSNIKGDKNIEGLFITIFNEQGESFDFNNYSGGEKLKITVAISEALSEIQKINFRILDELFIGLDEESTESFAKILNSLQGRFSQFLCISHLRNIKDLFHNKITTIKTNGITKIK